MTPNQCFLIYVISLLKRFLITLEEPILSTICHLLLVIRTMVSLRAFFQGEILSYICILYNLKIIINNLFIIDRKI